MRIGFYAPFKPLGHAQPSGDLVIATGLFQYLENLGHQVMVVSDFRARWIYWKPWRWLQLVIARKRAAKRAFENAFDLWITYHTYYKAPDLLGPLISKRMKIPYVIFQGIYATKRKKKIHTWPGYIMNKKVLCAADHIFTNKQTDLKNLLRLLPSRYISYMAPGVYPQDFCFDAKARAELRQAWNVGNEPVVLSAAMFRPGIKTEGLSWVIRACGKLYGQGRRLYLIIAGDGREREKLHRLADAHLPERVVFVGKVPRENMHRYYSAGDVFAFPGIKESLGMVFLEAQASSLPVVAFKNSGIPEVVREGQTGFLVRLYDFDQFVKAIDKLLAKEDLRKQMGRAAQAYVRKNHDIDKNYKKIEVVLKELVQSKRWIG
ncbi:glycosyltransferase family 4 protein [Thermodesulfobacteriota bacterium]